jgi:hypothetical protein
MRSANSGQSARSDFAALRDELREQTNVFVIDGFDFFDAELANFLAAEKFTAAFTGTSGSSAGTRAAWSAGCATLGAIAAAG